MHEEQLRSVCHYGFMACQVRNSSDTAQLSVTRSAKSASLDFSQCMAIVLVNHALHLVHLGRKKSSHVQTEPTGCALTVLKVDFRWDHRHLRWKCGAVKQQCRQVPLPQSPLCNRRWRQRMQFAQLLLFVLRQSMKPRLQLLLRIGGVFRSSAYHHAIIAQPVLPWAYTDLNILPYAAVSMVCSERVSPACLCQNARSA